MHPIGDKIKVKITTDEFGFGDASNGTESGVVVEVPDTLMYFGFHSSFEIPDATILKKITDFYATLMGKKVFWESLQDRGRRFKEGKEEYVILNMSDVIGYTDDLTADIQIVDQVGKAGSFNL